MNGPLAGAGGPRRREEDRPLARRVGSFLVWWVLLMGFWVWADDSLLVAELLVGAAVAAMGAALVELAQHQAASRIRIRAEWLGPAVKLPIKVAADTVTVFAALASSLVTGRPPRSGFAEQPVRAGGDSAEAVTRRALIVGGSSLAPNTFALGIDCERDVMVVHHLVVPTGAARQPASRGAGGGDAGRDGRAEDGERA